MLVETHEVRKSQERTCWLAPICCIVGGASASHVTLCTLGSIPSELVESLMRMATFVEGAGGDSYEPKQR